MPRAKGNQITIALIITGILLAIGIYYGLKIFPERTSTFFWLGVLTFPIIIISAIVLQATGECSSCEYIFTTKEIDKQEIGSKTGYKTVTRKSRTKESNETSEWEEQIRVKTVEYLHTYQCTNCGHTWNTKSTEELHTFDD